MEKKAPPYNIMSTAKPRGEEDERKYTLQARTKPYYKLLFAKEISVEIRYLLNKILVNTSGGPVGRQHPFRKSTRFDGLEINFDVAT